MNEVIDDYDAIAKAVQLYIDGGAEGDVSKLKEAFHDDARMFGHVGGHRLDVPIGQFFDMAASGPMNSAGTYRARVVSITQVGDAGQGSPKGRLHHSSFGPDNALMVYDVWESQAAFDKFGETLMPILSKVGVDPGAPDIMPVHKIL